MAKQKTGTPQKLEWYFLFQSKWLRLILNSPCRRCESDVVCRHNHPMRREPVSVVFQTSSASKRRSLRSEMVHVGPLRLMVWFEKKWWNPVNSKLLRSSGTFAPKSICFKWTLLKQEGTVRDSCTGFGAALRGFTFLAPQFWGHLLCCMCCARAHFFSLMFFGCAHEAQFGCNYNL